MKITSADAFRVYAGERLRELASELLEEIPFENPSQKGHDECVASLRDAFIEMGAAVLLHQYRYKRALLLPQVRVAQGAEQKLWHALTTDIFVAHRTMQRQMRDVAVRQGLELPWHGVPTEEQAKVIRAAMLPDADDL